MANKTAVETTESMEEILASMGVDFTEEELNDTAGFNTIDEVENPNSALRGLKMDFDASYMLCIPTWMLLPFDIRTGKLLANKKSITTLTLKMTTDEAISLIVRLVHSSDEYAQNLSKSMKIPLDKIKNMEVDEDGSLNKEAYMAFCPYINLYSASRTTQRFRVSPDRTITRLAIMPTNNYGRILFNECDQKLVACYTAEALLLNREIELYKEEAKARGEAEKVQEKNITTIKSNKIMTPPRETNIAIVFGFPSDSSGVITPDTIKQVNNQAYNFGYSMCNLTIGQDIVAKFRKILRSNYFKHLSYIPVVYHIPVKSTEVPNLGVAIQKATFEAPGTMIDVEEAIPDLYPRIAPIIKDTDLMSEDRIIGSVSKFETFTIEQALECFAHGMNVYSRCLNDKAFLKENTKSLVQLNKIGAIQLELPDNIESSATVIDINNVKQDDENEMEHYYDSSDLEGDTDATKVTASDFVQ